MTQAVTATGQVAHDAGMSFEELAAISAKVAERTREDGSSIGNAMKTIITRISKVNKMPQYADEIDSSTVSKASESLAAVGVQVYQPSGEMNDMITILSQLREKWDGLSDAQKSNIAFNIAATRQTSKFKNILMAWTDSMELAEHATNAQGGALENQEKYEESIVGKTQKIRTELDSFWIDLYNSDATKGILDFVINLAEAFNSLSDSIGPLQALLTTTFGGVALKGIGGGLLGMMNAGSGAKSLSDIFSGAHAADIFRNTFGKNAAEWATHDFDFAQNMMMQKFPAQQELLASATSMDELATASITAQQASANLFKSMMIGAGVIAGLVAILYIAKKGYDAISMSTDALVKRNQHMLEIDQKQTQAIKDEKENYDNQASSLQSLLDKYEEAEYGSQEYYNIRQQIADQFPSLIVGYDSEGQAIIANNDAIQSQIDYYHDLADAKQEALKAQAERTINRETGKLDEHIGGIFNGDATGNSSLSDLTKRQRELTETLNRQRESIGKKISKEIFNARGEYIRTETFIRGSDEDKEYQQTIDELEKITQQIQEARNNLKDAYAFLVSNIDTEDEQLIGAMQNLEQLATLIGTVDVDQFTGMLTSLQGMDLSGDNNFADLMNNLLNPDLKTITADEYFHTMNATLGEFVRMMGLTEDQWYELSQSLGIMNKSSMISQKISSIVNGTTNGISNKELAKNLGIDDLEGNLGARSAAEVLGISDEKFFSDEAKKKIFKDYKDSIKEIQDEGATLSKAQKTDWKNAKPLTDDIKNQAKDAIQNYQNELQKIEDWGLTGETFAQHVFGNVDMDKRQIITWTDELKDTYKNELASWDYEPETGGIDTVFGGSSRFGENVLDTGIEIAYTPIITDNQGKTTFLDKNSLYTYIEDLVAASSENGEISLDTLFALDKQGKEIGGQFISNVIAAADKSLNYENNGNFAEKVGRMMHFSGDYGSLALAAKELQKAGVTLDTDELYLTDTGTRIKEIAQSLIDSHLVSNIDEAIQKMAEWGILADDTAKGIKEAFEEVSTGITNSINAFTTGISSYSSAISEMQKNGAVTKDTYSALIGANEAYQSALVESSSGMQLNVDRLQDVKDAEEKVIRTKLSDEISNQSKLLQTTLSDLEVRKAQLIALGDVEGDQKQALEEEVARLMDSRNAIEDNIGSLQRLQGELDAATSKYKQWQDAQSGGDAGDQYDSIFGYKDTFEKAYKQHRYGDEGFQKFVQLFTGEGDNDVIAANGKQYYDSISKFMKNYFTEGASGVNAFYKTIQTALSEAGLDWTTSDGGLDIKNYDVLRHVLTDYFQQNGYGENFEVTSELLEIIGKAFREYGLGDGLEDGSYVMDVTAQQESLDKLTGEYNELTEEQKKYFKGSDEWNRLQGKIDEVQQEIDNTTIALNQAKLASKDLLSEDQVSNNLNTLNQSEQVQQITGGTSVDVPVTFSNADQAEASFQGLVELKRQLMESGEIDIDGDEIKAVDELIKHALASKHELIHPAYIDIEVSDVAAKLGKSEEEVSNYKQKLDEMREAFEEYHRVFEETGGDANAPSLQEAGRQLSEIKGQLEEMDPNGELAKAFDIDTSSLGHLKDSLNDDTTAADNTTQAMDRTGQKARELNGISVGNFGLPVAEGYATSLNIAFGNMYTNLGKLTGKDWTINVKANTPNNSILQGAHQYTGTASFARGTWSLSGKAAARGDMGAKKTETALVGELGPEMRVRGSRWELLGQNGAEFTDVRKGDIIFNHKQTESLLKNGHIDSRGKAIAQRVIEDNGAFAFGTSGSAFNKIHADDSSDSDGGSGKDSTKEKTDTKDKKKKNSSDEKKKTDKALENFKKALENIVDWIEVKLSRQTDKIDGYISKAESALDKASSTLTTTAGLWAKKNYYRTASSSRQKAISAIYDQIGNEDRGSQYYYQFADAQMATARKKGLITKKEEITYKKLVKNGQITSRKDIEALVDKHIDMTGRKLSEKDKKQEATRLYEAINVYKEWYEKGYEAEKAMAELNEQLREQVKALKEIRDAERDARIERSKTLTQIKTGGFQTTSDTDATYSNLLLDSSNADLDLSNRAYASETGALTKQKNKYGKYANKAFSAARSEVKRTTRGKGKGELRAKLYKKIKNREKKYKKEIQTYVKKNEIIPDSIINEIQKVSPDAAARLITYNETIGNWQRGLLEEVAAYAENNAAKVANTNSKYQNKEQAFSNDISLKEAQKNNRTTASGKNSLLDDEIVIQGNITTNAKNRLGDFEKQLNNLTGKVKGTNVKSMVKKMGLSTSEEAEVQKAVNAADGKNPIPNIDQLADLYSKGKISQNFMYWCINYNDALEAKKEAEYAYLIAQETEKQENSARFYEEGKNISDEADRNKNTTLGYDAMVKNGGQYTWKAFDDSNAQQRTKAQSRISLAEAQGHYASESDYIKQIQMNNRDLKIETQKRADLVKQFNDKVKANPRWVGTAEYHQFLELINDSANNIDNLTQSTIELAKAIKKLEWQKFDDGMAKVARFNSEIDYFINLLSNQTLFDEDNKGNITKYGMAAIDLQNTNMLAYAAEAQQYQDQLNKLLEEFKSKESDLTDKEFDERKDSLIDKIRELTSSAESSKQTLIDYARQAYEAQLSYLNKTIDKYKELKNAEKDAYDYQKQISESTKNITNLEKQLAAYEGNTSEEAAARIQKLRADLKEAKQNQSDQQYDKYLSDSQKMLDDLSNNFQEWIGSYMQDRDRVVSDLQQELAGKLTNLGEIDADTVETLQEFETSLNGGISTLSFELKTELDNNGSTIDTTLNNIYTIISNYIKDQPFQEEASIFESAVKGYENLEEITLRDYDAIKQLGQQFNSMDENSKHFVSQKAQDTLNAADAYVDKLKKAENDRLAKEAEQKRLNDIAKQTAETAKTTTQNKAAEEKARAMDEDTKNKQREAQADADAKAKASSKKTVDTKEQSILDKIKNVQNQMKNNRNSYKATKKTADKAKLDLAYNKLQVQLNKLNQQLAEYRNNKSVVGKAVAAAVVKGKGFASGSKYVKKDQLAYTQEKGQEVIYRKSDGAMLTPLGKGDKVFTNAMTENLWKLAQMNIPDMINSAMSQPIVQNTNQNINQSMGDVQFVFNLPNVTNYDQFKSQLVADKQFQSALQEMTLGAAMGRNSLSKYKYAN